MYRCGGEKMHVRKIVSDNLKQIKKERKLTRTKISDLTGISTRELNKIERDQVSITLDTLQKLADGLDLTVIEMISERSI